jgi:hypothetical protein
MALYLYVPFATEFVLEMAKDWKKTALAAPKHKDYEIIQYKGKASADNLEDLKAGDTLYILCHGDPKGLRFADRARIEGKAEFIDAENLALRVYGDGLPNVAAKIKLYACEANTGEAMWNLAERFCAKMVSHSLVKFKTATPKFSIFAYSKSVSNPMTAEDKEIHKRAVEVVKVKDDEETLVVLGRAKEFRVQLYPQK